ncbi:pantoate--beta-alanine ligase [Mesorhizobium sp. YC-39]|uniref:pantoate--beta-alanine ligase n=1 Tax=Mesorhizobium sp. YC-39 TaxID=2986065 RepID=UPI0039960733
MSGVGDGLCGTFRRGHFDGVATVVAKLCLQTGADFGFFGEKDFQQLQLVRRMVRDLGIPITIVPCPTVREADGLALSSHYVRLSPVECAVAPKLPTVLLETAEGLARGSPVLPTLAEAREAILAAGYREVEYLELRDEADLRPTTILDRPATLGGRDLGSPVSCSGEAC